MRPGPAGDMETSVIRLVILGAISGLCYGDGLLPDSLNAAVGGKVTFTTTVTPPETPFLSVSWSFTDIRGSSNIITSSNMDITGPAYTDRITFFRSNGSLELWNLTPSDSGEYSILISNGAGMQNGKCILVIDAPVSNVVVTISNTDLSELSSSVSLSCSSSGSFLSFLWLNGSSEVTTSDRVQLTDGNSTLTVANVTRYDQGPFRCHVFNNFSNDTSDPVKLDISYGPENINLTISPSQEYFEEGSNISMMCSADSRPPALFQWFLNGDLLSNTGPELSLMNIQMNQSGRYSCLAFNNKTLRNQTSQPATVSVPTPVSNVVVASNNTDLMEFSSSVSLSCSVSSGSFLSFLWLNSSSEVTESERVRLTDGGATLTIINVTRYDQGPFRCRVSNGATIETSQPVNLFIQFGPDNMAIKAPKTVGVGYYTMLYCSTMSVPAPTFTWLYDGKPTSMQDSVYIIPSTRSFDGGTYTCTAVNAVTGLSQTVSHKLTVGDFSDCDCSVAAGRATMLTFVCLLIAIVCGAIACCMLRRNRVKRKCAARQKESVTENRSDM